ncbi:MAG: hypothetical protein K9M11_02800 [Candidatus Pacebacteria bacterium]|nr:hypothetical protein [Candidatus Paceibacterota bacterium]
MLRNSVINFTLKIALAFPLFYSGLAALIVPDHVLSFWPTFISSNINESVLIFLSGFCSFALIGWLFSNKIPFASTTTAGIIFAVVGIFNITDVPFIIDLAPLFLISLALSFRYYPRIRVIAQTKVTSLANVTVHEDESITESVTESGIHTEHDQHIFIPKQ